MTSCALFCHLVFAPTRLFTVFAKLIIAEFHVTCEAEQDLLAVALTRMRPLLSYQAGHEGLRNK